MVMAATQEEKVRRGVHLVAVGHQMAVLEMEVAGQGIMET
jgi:hypothetical protein